MSTASYEMPRFLQTVDVIVIDAEKCLFWHGLSVIKVSSVIYLKLLTETRSWGSKSFFLCRGTIQPGLRVVLSGNFILALNRSHDFLLKKVGI